MSPGTLVLDLEKSALISLLLMSPLDGGGSSLRHDGLGG